MSETSCLLGDSKRAYTGKKTTDPKGFRVCEVPSRNPLADKQVALITDTTADSTLISSTLSTCSLYKHAQCVIKLDSLRRGEDDVLEHDNDDHYVSDCDSLRAVPQAPSWRMSAMAVLWGTSSKDQYDSLLCSDYVPNPNSVSDTPHKQVSSGHSLGLSNDEKEDAKGTYIEAVKRAVVGAMCATRRAISIVKSAKFIWDRHNADTEKAEKEKMVAKDSPPLRVAPLSCYMEKDSCMEKSCR